MDVSSVGAMTPHAVSGASWGGPPQQKMSNLFAAIDTAGVGSITQPQLAQAFQTLKPPVVFQQQGPAALFAKLDPKTTGSVSKEDFITGMTELMVSLRAPPAAAAAAPKPETTLAKAAAVLGQLGAPGSILNQKV